MMKYDAFIAPLRDLYDILLDVQKPARYIGGEAHSPSPIRPDDMRLKVALSFPDLYEIGMSNNAIRIIYSLLNEKNEDIVCERVFAPAPDFEKLLIKKQIPLYTLESGIPLCRTDVVAFSVGYELLATNILTILERGGISIYNEHRNETDPIVMAGGPAITNPAPFSRFIDAVWIGEAEEGFAEVLLQIAYLKRQGATRTEKLRKLAEHQSVWISPYTENKYGFPQKRKIVRSIYNDFSAKETEIKFPLPVINPIHAHGSVEIMRGCPNGCRFCHAGYYYRPQRAKPRWIIAREVEKLIQQSGYREITLSSLSSGDYPGISELFDELNADWANKKVSFQLPSLKVESFTLPLLQKMAEVRKSGLTFAIETPLDSWQCALNKRVPFENVVNILHEATQKGFKSAKFYFMIGLPVSERGLRESEEIVKYIESIAHLEKIALHVNVGTFIPKPHTPFEREQQLSENEALECISFIKRNLRYLKNVEVSYHAPFLSLIEGIISRGDESISDLIINAYKKGSRLDAWDEYVNKEAWKSALEEYNVQRGEGAWEKILAKKDSTANLPWKNISLRVSEKWLDREKAKSEEKILSATCDENCKDLCGVCSKTTRVVSNIILNKQTFIELSREEKSHSKVQQLEENAAIQQNLRAFSFYPNTEHTNIKIVASWSKNNSAVFYPLHNVSNSIIRSLQISGFPLLYTNGFNPQPRIELCPPLSLGSCGENELAIIYCSIAADKLNDFERFFIVNNAKLLQIINKHLPSGIAFNKMKLSSNSKKKATIGSTFDMALWSYEFKSFKSFKTALDILEKAKGQNSNLLIQNIADDNYTIQVYEAFVGASGKSQSFLKELKLNFPLHDIAIHEVVSTRKNCYGKDGGVQKALYDIL